MKFTFWIFLCLVFLVGCVASPTTVPQPTLEPTPTDIPSGPPTRFKLSIATNGIYHVTAIDLQKAGADIAQLDSQTLQLFLGDKEIPIRVQGEGKDLTFDFYGQATNSIYSTVNVYWLTWGAQPGKRIVETTAIPSRGTPKESFSTMLHFERPTIYAAQFGELNAPWFWQSLSAPATTTLTVTLPSAVAAQAKLRMNLWGSTQDSVNPDHHLRLFFNDARIADESWDGQGAHAISATVPANNVRAGINTVRLVAPGDTKAQADVVLLSSIDITFTQKLSAQDDALAFEGNTGTFRVGGFSSDAIDLYDISNPIAPTRLVSPSIASRTITFASESASNRRWLAVGANARKPVARIAPMSASVLRSLNRQADYVVITHPDFINALQPLVQWRQTHGLKPRIVTTTQVYDEFGFGAESPLAIREFLNWIQQNWKSPAPRFVLLVGKASYDYRDYMNAKNKNLLPTFLIETPHLRQAASDNWFVNSDEKTGRPNLAIGRIPAKTPEQVTLIVNKIIAYESQSADWRQRAVFVADDKDPSFIQLADILAGQVRAGMQSQKVYLANYKSDVKSTRDDLIAKWNAGAAVFVYIGHGSIDTWAEGPLFSAENLGDIKNGDRLPILITPTCLDGFFSHPQIDSLAEGLLFKNDGGIIAGLVPTGLSVTDTQSALMQELFKQMFGSSLPTLGEAIMRAKRQVAADTAEMREVIDTFGLLGDPGLTMGK
ncbi:MAG: hypothetical protein HZB51_26765 [Chloroflexi bacterium]|nr:hypothetical protein [Chloroflexota bacterium]